MWVKTADGTLRIQYAFRELLEDQAGQKNNPQKVKQRGLGPFRLGIV